MALVQLPLSCSPSNLAWAAGVIDRGSSIYIRGQSPNYRLTLVIQMAHKPTIERLQAIFGCGTIRPRHPAKESHRVAWQWTVTARRAARVLMLVRPYLLTKADQADIAARFIQARRLSGKLSSEVIAKGRNLPQDIRDIRKQEYGFLPAR